MGTHQTNSPRVTAAIENTLREMEAWTDDELKKKLSESEDSDFLHVMVNSGVFGVKLPGELQVEKTT